jgi:hypothetical protein
MHEQEVKPPEAENIQPKKELINSESVLHQFPVESAQQVSDEFNREIGSRRSFLRTVVTEDTEARMAQLAKEPVIDGDKHLREAITGLEPESHFEWIPTDKIVGTWGFRDKGWATEFSERKGRLKEVAKEILDGKVEEVFHPTKETNQRIRLISIPGPAGNIYLAADGSHRVGAAKMLELGKIPCEVQSVTYPRNIETIDESQAENWQRSIDLGLIKGTVQTTEYQGKKLYTLTVEEEVVPWISADSWSAAKVSQLYEQLYPGSLDDLQVPKEVLTNFAANNAYHSDHWEEWKQRYMSQEGNANNGS